VLQSTAADVTENTNPIRWSLRRAESTPLARGETTIVQLAARIDEGWHLYGLDLPDNGPIPTAISLAAGQPFALAGPIEAAKGKDVFDANFGMKLELYTGTATFGLPIRVAPTAAPGSQRLAVQAHYQSCSDTICLPPRTVTVELTLEVR
jgi:thiol:disulfide interchange protein DsbD